MHLLKLSVLVIISCLCPTEIYSEDNPFIKNENGKLVVPELANYCVLSMVNDNEKMPVPFKTYGDTQMPMIHYPSLKDMMLLRKDDILRLSCTKSRFSHDRIKHLDELTVRCVGYNNLEFEGHNYHFNELECESTPSADFIFVNASCHSGQYDVYAVGFTIRKGLIPVYTICFNPKTKDTLYTWYSARLPFMRTSKEYEAKKFFQSEDLYGHMDLDTLYTVENQTYIIGEFLKNKELAEKYVKREEDKYLIKGQLASSKDFYYVFEQLAAFYYVNTAPRWKKFDDDRWALLEESLRDMVFQTGNRYMFVSGVYGSCKLRDKNNVYRHLSLSENGEITVPMVFWKLLYNVDDKGGIVFLGTNNPYLKDEEFSFLCENLCQNGYRSDNAGAELFKAPNPVYCCDLDSFQRVYGSGGANI
uniref:DNA/RNA non-specific endonuclease/pyrophosphatase/phosphodiesterase domain-containing protein n=1 Tax=Sipha flava TaxID=143950 RepID=A0A2S2QHN7_9HEMI